MGHPVHYLTFSLSRGWHWCRSRWQLRRAWSSSPEAKTENEIRKDFVGKFYPTYSYKDKCSKGGTIGAQGKCCCSSQTDKVVRRGCLNIKCWTKIAKTFLVNGWLSWRDDNRSYLDHLWFADSHHEDVRHPAHLLEVARPEMQGRKIINPSGGYPPDEIFGQIQKGILDILDNEL